MIDDSWYGSRVNNFSRDVSDGENYTVLLNQLKPAECPLAPLQTKDIRTRAEQVNFIIVFNSTNLSSPIRYFKTPMPLAVANTSHLPR